MPEAADWQPLSRTRAHEHVLGQIEEKIVSGVLRVGDRLPPERDLAAMLGVGRGAVREALRVLESQGVLRRPRVGTGPDAGSVIAGTPGTGLAPLIRIHAALASFDLSEITEARVALERAAVALAASQAGPDHVSRMARLLERMDDPALPREEFNDLDTAFHMLLAEAASNRLITALTTAIRGAIRPTLLNAFGRLEHADAVLDRLRREHRALYEAVANGEGGLAADLVERHIRAFHQTAGEALDTPGA
ncbi:FadR/GntR family transcriptional regulator [Streptomyces sp. SBT349]|uniref:FadR/GntR family transcriptional regulator n=1 Tax=Streptomyces sp. SBT349 TaxID=1580539 RepID=UPI00066B5FF9|nr:FCD domain-containing protein [Streptomyces sp. SBT349]